MPGMMTGVDFAELVRRLEQLARYGTIAAVDHTAARCRVQFGRLLSTWVPWLALRAGTTRHWSPPTVGEQCLLISPGGDPAGAVALIGLYSTSVPAPSDSADLHITHYADGAIVSYDHVTHRLVATLPEGGHFDVTSTTGKITTEQLEIVTDQLTVNAGQTDWTGPIDLTGRLDASDDVTAAGISLKGHKHSGVSRGGALTDPPQ